MKLPPRIESIIDAAGLVIALAVDLVLNVICFSVLAPDMLTKIAFISIGIMIVLFVFRSWAKGFIFAWLIFVSVVFFFDFSFVLEATRTQAGAATVETDSELIRLTAKADAAAAQVLTLQAEHAISTRPETLADVKSQIETAQANVRQYEAERKARIRLIESGNAAVKIKSSDIFSAIPAAWNDSRYIPLAVFALVFLGLQLIVTTSIDRPRKSRATTVSVETDPVTVEPEPVTIETIPVTGTLQPPPTVELSHISQFVTLSWYRVDQKTSEHILPKESFFDYMRKRNIDYDNMIYEFLITNCVLLEIITDDGTVKIKSKQEAITMLENKLILKGV